MTEARSRYRCGIRLGKSGIAPSHLVSCCCSAVQRSSDNKQLEQIKSHTRTQAQSLTHSLTLAHSLTHTPAYYAPAHGFLLAYDSTNRMSFTSEY